MRSTGIGRVSAHLLGIALLGFISFIAPQVASAQPVVGEERQSVSNIQGPIEIKCFVKELMNTMKGVIVTIYEDADGSRTKLNELQKIVTPGNGQFTFKLNINRLYMIEYSKPGYTSKKVDFDTDVKMARPEHTKVPTFEFEVQMVKDLDGLAFKSSVAKVFYHIKRNELDYELDYSKEEMLEEERKIKELEEKRRLAEIAAQKKLEVENQALSAREKDRLAAESKIKAAVLMGSDEKKVKEQLVKVFSDVDSLRYKKADAMYLELQKERQRTGGNNAAINYGSIFDAAVRLEDKVVADKAAADAKKQEELRKVKTDVVQKQQEAIQKEQEAQKLIMQNKLAQATAAEDARRAAEEKAKRESVYNALLNSSGSKEKAIANLMTVFAKGDEYKEEKAEAMYMAYEKARQGGKTLANMNYSDLFSAARQAEDAAVEKKLEEERRKGNDKTNEIIKSLDEKKLKEESAQKTKIEAALAIAKNETERKQAFIEALPKNDPYRQQKGEAMYAEFQKQQQALNTGGSAKTGIDFGSIFGAAETAELTIKNKEKEELAQAKRQQQDAIESKLETVRSEKSKMAQEAATVAQDVQKQKLGEAANAKEKKLADAIGKAEGDRSKAIQSIMSTFEKGTEYKQERAEAIYDAYLAEIVRIKNSGNTTTKIDFGKLFGAADKAELEAITKQYEAKKAEEDQRLANYTAQRTEKAVDLAQVKAKEAEEKAATAAADLAKTKSDLENERIKRDLALMKQKEQEEKTLAMEEAKRAAELREREQASMSQSEKDKLAAAEKLRKETEAARAKLEAEERRKAEIAQAAEEKQRQADLALQSKAEKERQAAMDAQKKEEERLRKEKELADAKAKAEESKRLEAERAEAEKKRQAEMAAAERKKAEELAAAQKAERERLLAAEQAEKDRLAAENAQRTAAEKAEKDRIAAAERKKAEELAAAQKAERERLLAAELAEKERIAAENAKKAAEEKAEKDRLAAEAAKKAADEKAERDRILAAEKAEKDRIAKEAADQKERERLALEEKKKAEADQIAKAAEEKRRLDEQFRSLIQAGDLAFTAKNYSKAKDDYAKAAALKPDDRELKSKIGSTDAELNKLAIADAAAKEKEQKFQNLLKEGDEQMADGEYPFARNTYFKAQEMKPNDPSVRAKIKQADDAIAAATKAREAEQAKERQYIVLMQDGGKAMDSRDYVTAKKKYNDALALKPGSADATKKLSDIKVIEDQMAAATKAEDEKKRQAQEAFAQKQKEEEERKAAIALERQKALGDITNGNAQTQPAAGGAPSSAEQERQRKFEALKLQIEDMSSNADERRRMFLSELAKLYPEGVTYEAVPGSNYKLDRYVINNKGVVNVYEKRTWDWGGVFYFKDNGVAITESLYNLELNRYKK